MTEDPYSPNGSPAPAPRRRIPRIAAGAGITAFLALAGAGLAFAVGGGSTQGAALSSSSSSSSASTPKSPPAARHHPGRMHRMGFALKGPGGAIVHGLFTVRNGSGYVTVAVQRGKVRAVSPTSITVQSLDGYKYTYTVEKSTVVDPQSGGISAVVSGDEVVVRALVQGKSKETATAIADLTKIGASRAGFGFRPAGPAGAGAPLTGPVPADGSLPTGASTAVS